MHIHRKKRKILSQYYKCLVCLPLKKVTKKFKCSTLHMYLLSVLLQAESKEAKKKNKNLACKKKPRKK